MEGLLGSILVVVIIAVILAFAIRNVVNGGLDGSCGDCNACGDNRKACRAAHRKAQKYMKMKTKKKKAMERMKADRA